MVAPNETRARDLTHGLIPCAGSRDVYHRPERVGECEACASAGAGTSGVPGARETDAGLGTPARSTPRSRPGEASEAALYAAFGAAGFSDLGALVAQPVIERNGYEVFVRQWPWGAYLSPPRRYCSDAGFPLARVLVECDGGAHAAGKAKQRSDTERRGLAGAAGWIVVAVTPEQVKDGRAVALVRAALERRSA